MREGSTSFPRGPAVQLHSTKLSVNDVDSLVDRLTKTNTTTARKAVLWSSPRQEYEYQFINSALIKTRQQWVPKYLHISKHYPGAWRVVSTEQRDAITARLSMPTIAHVKRAQDNIERRQVIEAHHKKMLDLDIGVSKDAGERPTRPTSCKPPQREDPVCFRRSARARSAPFPEWRETDF